MVVFNFHAWMIAQLRRISYRWAPRSKAKSKARIKRGVYRCAKCKGEFGRKEIAVDHKKPVIDPKKGFTSYDDVIKRLFCEEKGFQVLCKKCHKVKTNKENKRRRQ